MLLTTHVKRFSVSHTRDFSYLFMAVSSQPASHLWPMFGPANPAVSSRLVQLITFGHLSRMSEIQIYRPNSWNAKRAESYIRHEDFRLPSVRPP